MCHNLDHKTCKIHIRKLERKRIAADKNNCDITLVRLEFFKPHDTIPGITLFTRTQKFDINDDVHQIAKIGW